MIAEARRALWVMVGFLAIIWIVQIFNSIDGYRLDDDYGIVARDVGTLPYIFTAPFLHVSWAHIEDNSGPLFIFGFLAAYRGVRKFLGVSLLIMVVSGFGAWLTNESNTVAVGASGVLFGYFGYIIVRGLFDRHLIDIVLGLVMALCFAYSFSVLLPTEGIDWQGHAFGFAAGLLGGWLFRERRPKQQAGTPSVPAPVTTEVAAVPPAPAPSAPKADPADRLEQLRRQVRGSG
jgi:membrane associated rhomboid family serine protease